MTYDLDSDDEGSIPWAMTQAIPSKPRSPFPPTDMPPPHLKGSDLRKYLIQKALEEKHGSSASKPAPVLARASSTTKAPLSPSRTNNSLKRPNPNGSSSVAPDAPPKKRRSLPPKVSPDQSPPPNSESPQPESSPSEGAQKVKKLSPAAMQAALDNSVYTRSSHQDAKRTKKGVPKIFLSLEQKHVLDIAKEGKSLFYTGSAGTGKSVVLKEMITTLRKKYAKWPNAVAITASTGIAACNIGGVTIHSFAGFGLGEGDVRDLVKKIKKNKKALKRWTDTKALIIDEVSMLDGDLFDKLGEIAKLIRKKPGAFGGIQLVVTGDFLQLPPVTKGNQEPKFCFQAKIWDEVMEHKVNLTQVFRQKDTAFINMLNSMRFGRVDAHSAKKFESLKRSIEYTDGIGPTELYPLRSDVDRSNGLRMSQLKTPAATYVATDTGTLQGEQLERTCNNFIAPKVLTLKVGAQVMCIKNIDETLVNGTMGTVLRFVDPAAYHTERDPENATGEDASAAGTVSDEVKPKAGVGKPVTYPVVSFLLPNGGQRQIMVTPQTWKVELPTGEVTASRLQFPLILAWAMSIHKSQGQTLDRVKVDLGKIFEKGQAYVALSRATNLDGLQVMNFRAEKVTAHKTVIEWTKTLEVIKPPSLPSARAESSGDAPTDSGEEMEY